MTHNRYRAELMTRLQLGRPLVFFDVETTGLDTFEDRIVELALCRLPGMFEDDREPTSYCQRFNPCRPIPAEATEIHGITDALVRDAPVFGDHAERIAAFFKGADIAGFNVKKFDIPMLMNELGRHGFVLDFPCKIIDCCDIYHQREPRDLEAAYLYYCQEDLRDAHSASVDVAATIEVLLGQLIKYELQGGVEALHEEFTDPGEVDIGGQLKRKEDGTIVVTFGKHKGTALDALPLQYLQWMKKNNVLGPDVKELLNQALGKGYRKKHGRSSGR